MRLFARARSGTETGSPHSAREATPGGGFEPLDVERGTASVHRLRSLESRLSSLMAVGLVCILGCALLGWYYSAMLRRPGVRPLAGGAARSRSVAEMFLPPLGPVEPPAEKGTTSASATVHVADASSSAAAPLLPRPVPEDPVLTATQESPASWPASHGSDQAIEAARAYHLDPHQTRLERQLSGPVFAREIDTSPSSAAPVADATAAVAPVDSAPGSDGPGAAATRLSDTRADPLDRLLIPTVTPTVSARVLPTQRLLLAKGAFIDCTLETAIDSTLPGMTTCITATDTFSSDGEVVLLERGSKLIGETRGEVAQGAARVFVLWTEARTPSGVVIPLASPGTDELGRSGLAGQVDRHFWQRFGAAVLISIIGAGSEYATQSGNGTVIYDPSATENVTAEVLKGTLNIPPTVVKNQGDRIQVLVARDLDFRAVYELRATDPSR